MTESPAFETPTPKAAVPRPWLRWSALLLALLGWWLSYDLYRLGLQTAPSPLLGALCDTTTESGCGSVLASEWGSVRLSSNGTARMPVSMIGMGYFAFLAVWFLFVGCPTFSRRPWHVVLVAVVAIGLLMSVQYLGLMATTLKQWCLGCVAVHIVNACIAVLTLLAFPWGRESQPYEPHPRGGLVVATFTAGGTLFVAHMLIGMLMIQSASMGKVAQAYREIVYSKDYIVWRYEQQPLLEMPMREEPRWLGPDDAPHTVVFFLDFACSRCREANASLMKAVERMPDRVRVDFRQFPLDTTCNPDLPRGLHPQACMAARQAEAVYALGGKEAFLDWKERLYKVGRPLSEAEQKALVERNGWDYSDWMDAVREQGDAQLKTDIKIGNELGIKSVPAVFLDGRRLESWSDEAWDALLSQ